jgi:hypothetical protein
MSTKAGTMRVPSRPAGVIVWIAAVSALAAVALIMSAVALTVAKRGDGALTTVADNGHPVAAITGASPATAGTLHISQGRVLVNTPPIERASALWDPGKLEAMQGRVLAEAVRAERSAALWDPGKLEAMQGRALAG